jgi:hypothetical protein
MCYRPQVRASAGGFDPVKQYQAITLSIPPVLTAGALPVVALSLLCKAATGSGLPGPLGLVEGLAWLTVPLGAPFTRLIPLHDPLMTWMRRRRVAAAAPGRDCEGRQLQQRRSARHPGPRQPRYAFYFHSRLARLYRVVTWH